VTAFYLDNDVSLQLVDLLQEAGHQVWHTRDLRQTTADDVGQLLTAVERGAVLVTHNYRDFELVHLAWRAFAARWGAVEAHPGILILPQAIETQLLQYLDAFLASGLPLPNACYRYRPSSGWRAVT
jgi:hypothetical protein